MVCTGSTGKHFESNLDQQQQQQVILFCLLGHLYKKLSSVEQYFCTTDMFLCSQWCSPLAGCSVITLDINLHVPISDAVFARPLYVINKKC